MPAIQTSSAQAPVSARKPASQSEQAYARLRDDIISLAYRPGDYLNIAALAQDTGFGRTPLNQALQRLASEGLVQIMPRKGVAVAPLSIDSAFDLIVVRIANERLCAKLAAQRMNADDLARLRRAAHDFEQASAANELQALMHADRIFHETIAHIAGNPLLSDMLSVLHAQSQRFWAVSLSRPGHSREVIAEHAAIVDALAAGDAELAADRTEKHILSFRAALMGGGTAN